MALRSDGESSWSRSTPPESEGRFGDRLGGDDMDDDNPELDTGLNESDTAAAVSDGPSHQYAERIIDMAAELHDIQFR